MTTEISPVCPRCGQFDAVRKVSAIVSEGVSVGEYHGVASLRLNTLLAQKLAFPEWKEMERAFNSFDPEPGPNSNWFAAIMVASLIVGSIGGVLILQALNPMLGLFLGMPLGGGGAMLITYLVFKMIFPNMGRQGREWLARRNEWYQRAKKTWNQLYYCARDDIVFDPATKKFAPADRMIELFYYQ